jgi:transposase
MAEISLKQKRKLAEILFTRSGLTKKETAEQVGVSAKTIGSWCEENNWEDMRASFARTRSFQLSMLNSQLNNMLDAINQREENERFATSKEGDVIMKLTASINYLERETGIATKIEIGKDFLEYLRAADLSKAQEFGELWDGYIKSKL